jgi:chemotaxis protein CheX
MAPPELITDTLIQNAIVKAVQNVCQTMLSTAAPLRGRADEPPPSGTFQMLGNVGFAGDANGSVFLCLTDGFAKFATGEILGMSPGEVEMNGPDVVKDAIGEITNMTAGGFKNQLCDIGYPCKLTLPTIVRGNNLQVSTVKGTTRHIFQFDCAGHVFYADIQFKAD